MRNIETLVTRNKELLARSQRLEAENAKLRARTRTLLTLAKMWRKAAWKWYEQVDAAALAGGDDE